MSIAEESLRMSGLFEAELLLELMLRYWQHPYCDDANYRNDLLESAAGVLTAAVDGQRFIEKVAPANMNFVAALWYAEMVSLDADPEMALDLRSARQKWAEAIERSLPSCFCNPDELS